MSGWPTSTRPAPATRSSRSSPPTSPPASPPPRSRTSPAGSSPSQNSSPSPARQAPPATAGWEQRWTSHRLLTIETETTDAIADPTPVAVPPVRSATSNTSSAPPRLGPDQAAAVRTLCSTRTLGERARRAGRDRQDLHPRRGPRGPRRLRPAPHHRRRPLRPSRPRARRRRPDRSVHVPPLPTPPSRHRSTAGDVVIVDEAGMAATVDLHRVITQARQVGAQVILVGDHHQLPEIGAGGVFSRRCRPPRIRRRRADDQPSPTGRVGTRRPRRTASRQPASRVPRLPRPRPRHHRHHHRRGPPASRRRVGRRAPRPASTASCWPAPAAKPRPSTGSPANRSPTSSPAGCWRSAAASSKPATGSSCCATAPTPPATSTSATGARHGSTTG